VASLRDALRAVSAGAAIAAATATGGPAAGASMAAFLATPAGQRLLDLNIARAEAAEGTTLEAEELMIREALSEINVAQAPASKPKRKGKKNPKLKKALEEANRKLRKQNGELRKGVTQSDVMSLAHKLRKKM